MGSWVHLGPQPSLAWRGPGPSPSPSVTDHIPGRLSSGWQRGPALQTLSAPSPALLPGSCTPTPETGWWSPPGSRTPGVPASPTLCPLCLLCKASPRTSFQPHVWTQSQLTGPRWVPRGAGTTRSPAPRGTGCLTGSCWAAREGYPAPGVSSHGLVPLRPASPLVLAPGALVFRKASKLN